jgi:protocatechuate 3,4-dioxygenase beta subunit
MHTAANWATASEAVSDAKGTLHFVPPAARDEAVIVRSLDEAWVLYQQKREGQQGWRDVRYWRWHECDVASGTPLTLCLVRACSVTGRVRCANGEPAAYVKVHVEHERPERLPRWQAFGSTMTDRDGAYRLTGLPQVPDPVRIAVAAGAGAGTSEAFELGAAGTTVVGADLRLPPPAIVEGRVRGADGAPSPGARVWLRDWDFAAGMQKSGSLVEVITDREGRYRFAGVPPGGAWLQVLVHGRTSTRRAVEPFEVEPGKTLHFELRAPKE